MRIYLIALIFLMLISGCILNKNEKDDGSNPIQSASNSIQIGFYKFSPIVSGFTFKYDDGRIKTGNVLCNLDINLRADKTYSMNGIMEFRFADDNVSISVPESGTWEQKGSLFCLDDECSDIRNVNSYSFEMFMDFREITQGDGFTGQMDFADWVKLNKQ